MKKLMEKDYNSFFLCAENAFNICFLKSWDLFSALFLYRQNFLRRHNENHYNEYAK